MPLTAAFNNKYHATRENDFILKVSYGQQDNSYDFLTRILTVSTTHSGVTAVPFAQLDSESLDMLQAKLHDLGGKPPVAGTKPELGGNYIMKKEADAVLRVQGGSNLYYYDFAARMATVIGWGGMPPSAAVVPFAQIDRNALEAFHASLTALKGNPPALPKLFAPTKNITGFKHED